MVTDKEVLADCDENKSPNNQVLRPKAGGEMYQMEDPNGSIIPSSPLYCPPSNLVLAPAPECRKLARGISRATDNEGIVWALRNGSDQPQPEALSNDHIFLLPDLGVYPDDLRAFIERDLFETAALVTLESCGRLNWWSMIPNAPRLVPLVTSGDGNCLPHAASLAAWGFHDRLLALRTRLRSVLTSHKAALGLRRRWRWSEAGQLGAAGLSPSEGEWEAEWEGALAAASAAPRTQGHLQGLDALHVMALAVAMKRPIVVFADSILRDFKGEALAPIPFGGIYLPLELDPRECTKTPILLAYDAGHFSALVPSEPFPSSGALIPLEDANGEPMPIKFMVDPGDDFKWNQPVDQAVINRLLPDEYQKNAVLETYMNIERIVIEREERGVSSELRRSYDTLASNNGTKNKFIVKGFGSLGRSVSSKLKKNFGAVGKYSKHSNDVNAADCTVSEVVCCRIFAGRAPVQDQMIQNYLDDACQRFLATQPKADIGNSKFYTIESHEEKPIELSKPVKVIEHKPVVRNIPITVEGPRRDRTLYLSRSTFYDDRPPSPPLTKSLPASHDIKTPQEGPRPCRAPLCMYYGSPDNGDYCSHCAKRNS